MRKGFSDGYTNKRKKLIAVFYAATHMLTLSEPPLDLIKDRTISVRPDSCRRSPHTTAGFELPFLGAHSRQRKQDCSLAKVPAETATQLLTQCQKLC